MTDIDLLKLVRARLEYLSRLTLIDGGTRYAEQDAKLLARLDAAIAEPQKTVEVRVEYDYGENWALHFFDERGLRYFMVQMKEPNAKCIAASIDGARIKYVKE